MNLKEIEKVVGSLQNHLFRNSNAFSVGMLKSHFKGAGLQFKEHQVYTPGDDVRFIDWKLSAKTNTTFVKTFEEERNVEIYVILDLSETMLFGYKGISKLQAALEIMCLIYLIAEKSKDKVAAIIQTDDIKILPLCSGQEGVTLVVSELEKMGVLDEHGKVNLNFDFNYGFDEKKRLALLKNLIAKGKEVVMLSDFSEVKDVKTLNNLLYRLNFHCFKVQSPLDAAKSLPYTVFGKSSTKSALLKTFTKKEEEQLKGRVKSLRVDERYLEKFVREML